MDREYILPAMIFVIVTLLLLLQIDTSSRVARIEAATQQILAMPEDHD